MLSSITLSGVLWVAGGALLTLVLLAALLLWISHEQPQPDPTKHTPPVARRLEQPGLAGDDPESEPPVAPQRDD